MAFFNPLVLISGQISELPPSDSAIGLTFGEVLAGSGLSGGGNTATNIRFDLNIASNASGLVLGNSKLSDTGEALVSSTRSLSSGIYASGTVLQAIASGTNASVVAASGINVSNQTYSIIANRSKISTSNYIAAGTIASGAPVGFDDNYRVQTIRQVSNKNNVTASSLVGFAPGANILYPMSSVYGTAFNSFLLTYRDGNLSAFGRSNLGANTSSGLSFEAPVTFASSNTLAQASAYDSVNQKFIIAYVNFTNSKYGTAVVGTVSGPTISYGTPVVFKSSAVEALKIAYSPTSNRVLYNYITGENPTFNLSYITSQTSGTTLNFGTETIADVATSSGLSVAYDPASSGFVSTYSRDPDSTGVYRVCYIQGSGVLTSNYQNFTPPGSLFFNTVATTATNKIAFLYTLTTQGSSIFTSTGAVSGFYVNLGPTSAISRNPTSYLSSTYESFNDRVVVFSKGFNNYGIIFGVSYTPSGDVQIGNQTIISPIVSGTNILELTSVYDPVAYKTVCAYRFAGVSGIAFTADSIPQYMPIISGFNNYLGVAQTNAASGQVVEVRLPGTYDVNRVNLNTGSNYFLDPVSSGITTSGNRPVNWSGTLPWGPVGVAVSSGRLLLTNPI